MIYKHLISVECLPPWSLPMQDVVFAFRQMRHQWGATAIAVITLGLGLGASLAVFTLVNAVLLRPLPYPEPDRLMSIGRGLAEYRNRASHRDVDFLRAHVRSCSAVAATVGGAGLNVLLNGTSSYQDDRLVSHQYFPALGIQPQWGRSFSPEEDGATAAPVVVLNERLVRALGLEPAAMVGRDIALGGRTHTIVGVLSAAQVRTLGS